MDDGDGGASFRGYIADSNKDEQCSGLVHGDHM
jgi:hypothetical protein